MALVREVLIVDDHAAARNALQGMVEHAGYPAVAFANPAGALARIAEHPPALILLDMMMPELDGAEFLRRVATIRGGAAVPIIVYLLEGMRRRDVLSAGVTEEHSKPVS